MDLYCGIKTTIGQLIDLNIENNSEDLVDELLCRIHDSSQLK